MPAMIVYSVLQREILPVWNALFVPLTCSEARNMNYVNQDVTHERSFFKETVLYLYLTINENRQIQNNYDYRAVIID